MNAHPQPVGRRGVLAAGAVIALAGCARIPMTSAISSTPVAGDADPGAPYVQPRPPADGADPRDIVTGFVQAGVGPEDDYAVAREYLTAEARDAWDPGAGITVYAGDREFDVSGSGAGTVLLAVQAVAQVDAHGTRTVLPTASGQQIDVALQQEDGQWRIAKPPPGIFLSEAAFEILFVPGRAYYLDARRVHLVPDVRWVPSRSSALTLLRALATGPSAHLAQAVRSALPDPFAIPEDAVSGASDGSVRVELPASLTSLPSAARNLALKQIDATLSSLTGLGRATIVAGGATLAPDASPHLDRPLPGHRPLGAGARGVISLDDLSGQGAEVQLLPDLAGETVRGPVIAQNLPLGAALREDLRAIMIVSTDRSTPRRDVDLGGELVAPTLDDSGYVWTTVGGMSGTLIALSSTDATADVKVDAPWLVGREVLCLDLASDATRLLVVSELGGTSRLDMCGVVRDDDGAPRGLTEPRQVVTGLVNVTQAGFFDEVVVLALGSGSTGVEGSTEQDPGDGARAVMVDSARGIEVLPAPRLGTERVAGTAVTGQILASTGAGVLLRSDGSSWSAVGLTARDPSFY